MKKLRKTLHIPRLCEDEVLRTFFIYLKFNRLFPLILLLTVSSCYTSKHLNYLQTDSNKLTIPVIPSEYRVQSNDVLSIKVQSKDPEQSTFFNVRTVENRNMDANLASLFLTGYTVDPEGMINLAIVGELKVGGLTIEEIRDKVQLEMDKYLVNSLISAKLTSFRISVVGDVREPGINYIYNNQATIFEGLSAAGDLNVTAKRNNIKLIRQKGGESIVVSLDLTDPAIIQSPYYFLQPNDVLYVDRSKPGIAQNNLGVFSLILSAITTTILVLNFTSN